MAWPALVFDIEPLPHLSGLRQLGDAPAERSDAEVYAERRAERQARGQGDFMPLHPPQRVNSTGGGFDLPVLHDRGLQHGVVTEECWFFGEGDHEFEWNNDISRDHLRQPAGGGPHGRECLQAWT